jgi:signal transduction histidine kinase
MADPRLLRELCHDLIEPASSIRLLASAACSQLAADSSIRDQLRVIASEAAQITEICRQVLDRPGRIGPVRLDTLAAEAAARVRLRYHGEVEGDISPATVLAHPAMLTRILNNLLSNACQAAGPHGHVRIRVALDQAQARLSIADSGPGLARAKSDRASLGLEITGRLVLSCGGTLQMNVSDLGGLCVTVGLARPPQHDGRSACALADGASAIGGPAAGPMPGNGDSPR